MSERMVVIFNHRVARFFRCNDQGQVTELSSLFCPDSSLHQRELYSDAPSRTQNSLGTRHAYEPHTSGKEKLSSEFARHIAACLEKARVHLEFNTLILVGQKSMLGALRKVLSKACQKQVIEECPKVMVYENFETINKHLSHSVRIPEAQ